MYQVTDYSAASGGSIVNQVQDIDNGLGQLLTEYQSVTVPVSTEPAQIKMEATVVSGTAPATAPATALATKP